MDDLPNEQTQLSISLTSIHNHHHHHHDEHQGHGDFASANKAHFNNVQSNVEDPRWVENAKRSARAILNHFPFDEESTTVLDFACNVGLLSREIAGHTKLLVGVDISQTPVDIFNEHVSNHGIPPEEMRAVCVELKGDEGELDGLKFDVVTCSASYHHFEDINKITKILSFFLKPGGVLLVVDITPKGDGPSEKLLFPENLNFVPHKHGLSEKVIKDAFDGAGLVSFSFDRLSNITIHEADATLFIATGTKPQA
jgi:2-polyprenyl-3-methyl-5-hydroxy-6-metoxy-1,4-benzoquinol methylase